ncbi:hypothetical protein EZS27_011222 [termite gut metagenome]|uniref:Type I restriction modification DNA specificity domain-containing protein n=1 Tax=termite gut metagenome TaxID=433724 RepID=A0A5J4S6D9_9ZZZZ
MAIYSQHLYSKLNFEDIQQAIIDSRLRLYSDKFFSIFSIIPPKDEQDCIVCYIKLKEEKINYFIQKKQRLIELLKEQRQSIIDEEVTKKGKEWIILRLKDVVTINDEALTKKTNDDSVQKNV